MELGLCTFPNAPLIMHWSLIANVNFHVIHSNVNVVGLYYTKSDKKCLKGNPPKNCNILNFTILSDDFCYKIMFLFITIWNLLIFPPTWPTYLTYLPDPRSRKFHASTKKMQKNTKNWYTIDALGAIFAIFTSLDTFTKLLNTITMLLQYYYNTFTILLQYFYNTNISKYLKILWTL